MLALIGLFFSIVFGVIFATIGGLIGGAVFKSSAQQPVPVDVSRWPASDQQPPDQQQPPVQARSVALPTPLSGRGPT